MITPNGSDNYAHDVMDDTVSADMNTVALKLNIMWCKNLQYSMAGIEHWTGLYDCAINKDDALVCINEEDYM